MATSINMRGKAATSGAAGGGGKSRLHRAFDDLMDHPNPATQQQFEEDYAMADPSSNLFNPRKVLSNRNNLKNYANKKGMPESRVNAMATKIAKAQMDEFHRHVAQSAIKSSLSAARSARQSYSVPNNRAMIPFIGGGGGSGRALTGEYIPASGSSSKELKTISRTLHEIKKIDSKELSIFTRSTAVGPFYGRTQAHVTGNRYAYAGLLGGPGGGAIGFPAPSYAMSRYTQRISAVGGGGFGGGVGGGFGPGGAGSGGGGITAGEAVEGGGAFKLLKRYIVPAAIVGAVATAPWWMSKLSKKITSGSMRYASLSQQMGRYGRAYGASKRGLLAQVMPNGKMVPNWMLHSGITPDEVTGLMSSYGAPIGSVSTFRNVMGAVGFANNLPGFGGMNKNVYASILGQGKALGITGNQSDKQYLSTFGRVVQSAVKEGMNRSQVVNAMKSSISLAAGGGALSINKSGLLDFGYRMMGSGAPGARTGASVLNFENQLNAGTSAVGKMPVQTMMYYQYMKGKTMKQILGSSYGSVMSTRAGRYAISSAQGALSHGSPWFAVQDLAAAAKGHPHLIMRIVDSYRKEMHLPSYMTPQITAALGLTSQSGAIEYGARGAGPSALQGPTHIKKATLTQMYHYETWSKSKRQRYRVLEATTAARELSQELKANHGNLRKAMNEYAGPGNHADTVVAAANARKIGWKGGTYFDKKKESIYRKELKAAGVPANEISAMISAGRTQNIDPLILYGIHTTQASNWGLLDPTTGANSSAHGPFQTITKYADAAWKGHPNQIRRYNKLASIAWATPGKLGNLNLPERAMLATNQNQQNATSKATFKILGRHLHDLGNSAKFVDDAFTRLGNKIDSTTAKISNGQVLQAAQPNTFSVLDPSLQHHIDAVDNWALTHALKMVIP